MKQDLDNVNQELTDKQRSYDLLYSQYKITENRNKDFEVEQHELEEKLQYFMLRATNTQMEQSAD